jgi:GT2 family glycosyltransferase/SAM-dependent methyltransferase
MIERRAGAPRLIDWTGERCVPWTPDIQVVYEHYHRYLWAAELVRGRRVLDVGSGEGFGSAILAGVAERVVGVELDATTVEHSRLNYVAPNLELRVGSALELEQLEAQAFDAVVMFELIEHVTDHERVLAGIEHVLAADGLLILSTPDRRMYTEATGVHNPFHEHELSEPELRELLAARFAHIELLGQRAVAGSRISALEPPAQRSSQPFALQRAGDDWRPVEEPPAMYLVAVASRAELPALPTDSLLADYELTILHRYAEQAALVAQQRAAAHDELERARHAAHALQHALDTSVERVGELRREVKQLHDRYDADLVELRRVRESIVWNGFQRARGKLYGALGGRDSRRGRALQASLRGAGRVLGTPRRSATLTAPPPHDEEIRLPTSDEPLVSLVVTAYTGTDVTAACLRSIATRTDGVPFEVVVVDDAADEANALLWKRLHGARVIVNEPGIGYLRSVNRGAAAARGRYLVLMNNDVEVEIGWLRALVQRAESAPDVGAVAPQLLHPDGRLQEAGSIVWRDGSGWNYGRDQDPEHYEFSYAREVDYASAACLLVRADAWKEVGGYDERFLPMYYEDADLCFALRAAGRRVVFEPAAHVVHHEGATAGTDLDSGAKRHQALNRPQFVEKWRELLEREHFESSPANVRRASVRGAGPHVLVVDHRVPMPDHDAGSLRMWRLLQTLRELGCRVTFAPENLLRIDPHTRDLQQLGVEVLYSPASIAEEIATTGAHLDLAILSRPYIAAQHMHALREHAPGATIAYDTVDLHFVRERRRAELGEPHAETKAATIRELELGLVRGSDVTIVVSDEERAVLEAEAPGSRVLVIPVVNEIAAEIAPLDGRRGVLFVGGFEHPPNVDGALFLVQEVMPLVWRQIGDVPVTIVGPHPTAEVQALAGPQVDVTGWVEDLQPLLDGARLMVAPLRYGAGMKGKVTQSLGAGLPVVTTPTGAEGLGAEDGAELLIGCEAAQLAEQVVRACTDDELWRRLSARGQDVVRRTASIELMRERLQELLTLRDERERLVASRRH